jgi:putative endonuclease
MAPGADLGRLGEEAALAHYRALGYRLVARNWRCSLGELDLVVSRGDILAFCEVKTRRGSRLGGPHEAVDARKQRKLRMLAEAFLAGRSLMVEDVRFDVASVNGGGGGIASLHVFEDAF